MKKIKLNNSTLNACDVLSLEEKKNTTGGTDIICNCMRIPKPDIYGCSAWCASKHILERPE